MATPIDNLLSEVLKLPPDDRARFAAELLASLDGEPDTEVEAAWAEEISARMEQIERGEARLVDWDQAMREKRSEP
jgi:putative addiction module component (TIGR02574 family)